MLEKLKTLTGVSAGEIGDRLAEPFDDPSAYKEIKGGSAGAAKLTDIDTAWMVERLNEVFGPYGLGWTLEWKVEDVLINGGDKRPLVAVKRAEFQYLLLDDEGNERLCVAPCTGGSQNELPFALKGMETSAIGNAVSKMCFQEQVYKGKLNHQNAKQVLAGRNGKTGKPEIGSEGKSDTLSGDGKAPPEPLASYGDFVVPIGKYRGKKLADLDAKVVAWYASEMKATNDATKELRHMAEKYQVELGLVKV
jgi:uncharacterized protein (DUF3820 family)